MDLDSAVSTDDKVSEDIEIKVVNDTNDGVNTDVNGAGEDTSIKNDASKSDNGQDDERSAGKVIANLGNEKKQIAEKFILLAKTNDGARNEVKSMLIADPSTASYIKSKFGSDYDAIMGDKAIVDKAPEVDVEKIREQERAKAQAEAIKESLKSNQDQMLTQKAHDLGFTTEEFELFKAKTELLGGDEGAMNDAALIVNRAKATAKSGTFSDPGAQASKPGKTVVEITQGIDHFATRSNDRKGFVSEIGRVKGLHRSDDYGKPVMDLPGL